MRRVIRQWRTAALLIAGWVAWPFFTIQAQTLLRLSLADPATFAREIDGFRLQPLAQADSTAIFMLPDSAAILPFCRDIRQFFLEKAYLNASIDSLQEKNQGRDSQSVNRTFSAYLYLGPAMRWVSLRPASRDDDNWLSAVGFREKLFTEKPLRHDLLLKLQQRLLETAENDGYPFAQVFLDSVQVQTDGGVTALLRVERNRYFSFKQLKIIGDVKLPKSFLPNYLGLRPGSPYSRTRVLRLRDQLRSLLFLETTANPTVTFAGSEATINLFLQRKRASRFDFIIGLLPQTDAANSKLLVTGTLSAAFQNALNLGERLSVEFERLRPETQKLDVQGGVPYVLGTPFGIEGHLNIFRRDSTWVDAQADIGVQYLFTGGDFVKFFWENKSSSLQKVDTLTILQTRRLPANLDLRQNGFGLETSVTRLDYRFNPRRGWAITLKTVAGYNTVQRNNLIENLRDPENPDFRFSTLYDSIAGREARFRLEANTEVYIPFFTRTTLKIGVRSGGIFAAKKIFANEQYRLGGNKRLRGFDEESLFATRFVVATAELRLLTGQNSYLSAFSDYGYLENITERTRIFLRPVGIGAGLTFETKAGIFGISLAVGRRDTNQAIDFRAAKFHLGYVSLF